MDYMHWGCCYSVFRFDLNLLDCCHIFIIHVSPFIITCSGAWYVVKEEVRSTSHTFSFK